MFLSAPGLAVPKNRRKEDVFLPKDTIIPFLCDNDLQRLNINYLVARSFYYVCSPLIGIKLEVEGEEHLSNLLHARGGRSQSAILVGNHQRYDEADFTDYRLVAVCMLACGTATC